MPDQTLNLGILAHIDAGKTSLSERLLFDNGAIAELGSVDGGNTHTDSNELERQRGITIRSAVASFVLDDLQVNLVDTPGHPDFIAEVERALSVLDGAVLVVSAVEGVQAQTRVLMRSLKRMNLPTLIFVNKVDRMGARYESLLDDIRRKLAPSVVPMERVDNIGTSDAHVSELFDDDSFLASTTETLAENDDELLARVVDGDTPKKPEIQRILIEQTAKGLVHPVFFGSALSGAGAGELTKGIRTLLRPQQNTSRDGERRGVVFAIERTGKGEKVAYIRLFSGRLSERERVAFQRRESSGLIDEIPGRISGMEVVGFGRGQLTAGNIAKVRGLSQVRVGDRLGDFDQSALQMNFSPPILESIVRPEEPERKSELHAALSALANEDPLIRIRTVSGGAVSVLLYGEVQKEVIAERLKREFNIKAIFDETQPTYFERPAGRGDGVHEFDPLGENDFWQTIGLRVEPNPIGSGNTYKSDVKRGSALAAYHRAIEESAMRTLQQGLYGWEVTDCAVTFTQINYDTPMSVAADFRNLTPIVLMRALKAAGTDVYEPTYKIEVDVPEDGISGVISFLSSLDADLSNSVESDSGWKISGEIPARRLQEFAVALPGLTHGEGSVWYEPGSDRRVRGIVPTRERFDGNPLDYREYLRYISNRDVNRSSGSTE
ncbi:TetM/TetW/TetO/TetS family tetracycline resistance ribosomal protection protein [Nocardia amamiensis]|uniref:TetM/TetW/TetO/TetS family tetracycline resistance ribosomal protection protein n=1 Tax=Nocardia amamiensis TaxID=404578 RepID=A0ABS0CR19_9NOCA|nr:TetM/TetW/TetO/TetS family tetracycline resistance ribosomal protection protein [Nocardia amamiensis]MBF6299067.1 TetM/TetW/TetO/TetS family tetracycline resistance ribosomal protection protein [Nocardia amamiensis]